MEPNEINGKLDFKTNWKPIKMNYSGLVLKLILLLSISLIPQCESQVYFFRPNLPEKLCVIGLIDADESSRNLLFEKSYQLEYQDELSDSLREFSFSISSSNAKLFSYQSDSALLNIQKFTIPDSIPFNTGEKYFLHAKEKSTSEIMAEIVVPDSIGELKFLSIEKEIIPLSKTIECIGKDYIKAAILQISFPKKAGTLQYFALLLKGSGGGQGSSHFARSEYLDFSIREGNSPGFFAPVYGLEMLHLECKENSKIIFKKSPVYAFFIDGSQIPDDTCHIKLSTQFQDGYSIFDFFTSFQIKAFSIPEELYLFQKSLNSYDRISKDPFLEPVNLNGNIKGGIGIFAIYKSKELVVNLKEWY